MKLLSENPFTAFRDAIQLRHRYEKVDELVLRQKLGEVSSEEVSDVNRVLGGNLMTGHWFVRGKREPAKIWAWNKLPLTTFTMLGLSLGAYGRLVKGYNNLWLGAGLLPITMYMIVASQRQPATAVENAYRYILAKRVATCELEANA